MAKADMCRAEVPRRIGSWWQRTPCENRAVRDGFCATHHPDAKHARDARRETRWRERSAAWSRTWAEEQRQREVVACRDCQLCAKHRAPASERSEATLAERPDGVRP